MLNWLILVSCSSVLFDQTMFRISCLSGLSGHVYRKVVEVARATGILGLIGFSQLRVALLIPLIEGFKPTQLKQLGETSILGFKNKSLQTFEPYPAFLRRKMKDFLIFLMLM
jgi:hypothetical protein